jgi:glycosyltransferase involved in cell wall biosynthesis
MFMDNKFPLVSVIIPTYNRGWILKEAIESVQSQTYKNFELIIVDDGSTDNTQDILEKFKEELIVIRQTNKGVSAARNKGVVFSRGTFISFLDSDDLWKPEKLANQVAFFVSNPEIHICQTDEIWIRKGKRVNPKKYHQKPSGMIYIPSLSLCLVSPSAVMMKKTIFQSVGGFDETFPVCEDYDLWLRIGCRYPVPLIEQKLVIKRGGHEDQLSRSPGLDKYRIMALKKNLEIGNLTSFQYRKTVDILKEKCRVYSEGCFKRGKEKEGTYFKNLVERYL